jgi:hypothetical protein
LTIDKAMADEQNLQTLPLALLVMNARSNDFDELLAFVPRVLVALNHLKPRGVTRVD